MNINELLEAAQLDALGLLDPEEQLAFENAFAAAPPAIRAQVRHEQSRLCRLESILPSTQPDPALRDKVLNKVSAAIAAETMSRIIEEDHAAVEASLAPAGRSSSSLRHRRVSPLWRAGTLGLAAAALLMGYTTVQMRSEYESLSRSFENDGVLNEFASRFGRGELDTAIIDARTKRVFFESKDPSFHGQAAIWMNPDWKKSRIFCRNLPVKEGQNYRVVALDEENRVVSEIARFESQSGLMSESVEFNPAKTYRLALVIAGVDRPASEGAVVLVSTPLAIS